MDAFAVGTRETLEKELTEKIEELEEERDKKLEEKEENIKKILEETQQEEKELRATEEDQYNRNKFKIQQEIAHQLMQLEEDKINLQIAKQEKERIYQAETERYTEATKIYFEDLKKALAKNYESELEKLKKKYQEAYRVEEIKEDKANQRHWQEQLAPYHQKELSLQHLWPYHYKEALHINLLRMIS